VWTSDFKPDELADVVDEMMTAGATAMKVALDGNAAPSSSAAPGAERDCIQ
jgi:hypothetical protein